ncbi:MAG: hypothetical protein ACON4C_07260 [Henriciella sp.]
MGGFGSGGHNRRGYGHVEAHRRLDAVRLQKDGVFRDGCVATVSWGSEPDRKSSLRIATGESVVRLLYKYRQDGQPWQDVDETVAIDWSPRHLGGAQAYFRCPRCAQRVRYLHGAGRRFLCRSCHGLVHASAREGRSDRLWRRVRKLRRSIGADEGLEAFIPPRPRYMRQAKYEAIVGEIERAERAVMLQAFNLFQRVEASLPSKRGFWS